MELDAQKGAQQKLILCHMQLGSGAWPLEGAQASFGRCWGRGVDPPLMLQAKCVLFMQVRQFPFLHLPQPHSAPQSPGNPRRQKQKTRHAFGFSCEQPCVVGGWVKGAWDGWGYTHLRRATCLEAAVGPRRRSILKARLEAFEWLWASEGDATLFASGGLGWGR